MFAGGGMGKRTHASYGASEEPPPGGDGGGGANTSMLGHLDTTIRSAPVPVLTEAELDAADEAATLDSTLMEQLQTVRRRGTSRKLNSFAIVMDPHGDFMKVWDQVSMVLLGIVAILTPYEVAFMQLNLDFWFFFNRAIDIAFFFDMCLNFTLAYRNEDDGVWVRTHRKIAWRYLTGWFFIDLLSVLPFDLIGILQDDPSVRQLSIIRFVRLARLVKLMRVLRVGRIFKRWESTMNIHYSVLSLAKFVGWMLMLSHWMACVWEVTSLVQGSPGLDRMGIKIVTWREAEGTVGLPDRERYLRCVYWAAMTLSTIGYGDISPVTTAERFVVTLCMLLGACLWAYIVANVCAIVTALDQHGLELKAQIDALNYFMDDKNLAQEWRPRLRQYFINRKRLTMTLSHRKLLHHMSPALRGEVCLAMNKVWIHKVAYFKEIGEHFSTAVALQLQPQVFAPEELITGMELHIVERGVCLKDGKVFASGMVWGEDMILSNPRLRMTAPATTLTYVDVQSLSKHALSMIMKKFPARAKKVRRAALWIAMRRLLIIWAFEHRLMAGRGGTLQGATGTVAAEDAKLRAKSKWDFRTRSDTLDSEGAPPADTEAHVVHTVNKVGKMVSRRTIRRHGSGRTIGAEEQSPLIKVVKALSSTDTSPTNLSPTGGVELTSLRGRVGAARGTVRSGSPTSTDSRVPNPLSAGSLRVLALRKGSGDGSAGGGGTPGLSPSASLSSLPGTPSADVVQGRGTIRDMHSISVHGFSAHGSFDPGSPTARGHVDTARSDVSASEGGDVLKELVNGGSGRLNGSPASRSSATSPLRRLGGPLRPRLSSTGSKLSRADSGSSDHTPSDVANLAVAVASSGSPSVSPSARRSQLHDSSQRLRVADTGGNGDGDDEDGGMSAMAQARIEHDVEDMTNRLFDEAEIRLTLAFQRLEERVGQLAVAVLQSRGSTAGVPSAASAPREPSIFRQPSRHGAAPMASPLEQAVDQEEADEARALGDVRNREARGFRN